jgi:hypothetical protein
MNQKILSVVEKLVARWLTETFIEIDTIGYHYNKLRLKKKVAVMRYSYDNKIPVLT